LLLFSFSFAELDLKLRREALGWSIVTARAVALVASDGDGQPDCYSPADRFAARTVFAINMAMVIRPTPPGTGVIAPATAAASA
jgi:hypothetical protein